MKKIISVFIATLMILSIFAFPANADTKVATQDAVLHFDANTAANYFRPFNKVYCHIWEYGGDSFYPFKDEKSRCYDEDGDGIWTYNLTKQGITLKENTQYCCVFSSNSYEHQYTLIFDTTVLGDTAYLTGEYIPNPNEYNEYYACWRNQDPTKHGPQLEINSIGTVYGTCIPMGKTAATIFEDALINILENARIYSGKTDQQIIDDMACSLDLSKEQVECSLEKTGVVADWSSELSTAKTENAVLHFDANTVAKHWKPFEKIYCHIWEYSGDSFYPWQNKKARCYDEDGDGIWTYNLTENDIILDRNKQYCCIFSTDKQNQHFNILFDYSVLGDTAYLTGEYSDSPEGIDYYLAYWRNQNPKVHGPELYISSLGEVSGTCIPRSKTPSGLLEYALINTMENARTYSGRNDQKIIDNLAYGLGLSAQQVKESIEQIKVEVEWSAELSTADKLVGDADLDGEISILDATAIQLHIASLADFSSEQKLLSDIDFDSDISVLDATQIQRNLAGYHT